MARVNALSEQNQPLFAAAALAAQATSRDLGFRQRDVRFFVELFGNWQEPAFGASPATIHNTQVQRQLEAFAALKWAKRVGRQPPRFRLTAEGLLGLLRQLALRRASLRLEEFFFVFHFLDAYGVQLRAMAERAPFDSALLAVDLAELVDPQRLVTRERKRLETEIERLGVRAEESRKTSQLARSLLAKRVPLEQVVREIETKYPYELNSQKPLRELLALLPEPWRQAELTSAAERRGAHLWSSQRALLVAYDQILQKLAADARETTARGGR